MTPTDIFKDVIDQNSAIAQLQKACQNPLHAYLFLGPKGSCKWNAAKAFAAAIMTNQNQKQNHERSTYLISKGDHPDLIKIEPTGNQYRDEDVQEIINEASRSPIEGKKKIIVADRFHTANETAVGRLLKTLEEPPESVIIILLSEIIPKNQITIASRCQKIQFNRISDQKMNEWLEQHVQDADNNQLITVAARGDIDRARNLISDPNIAYRHELWRSTYENLKSEGHAIAASVSGLQKAIDEAQEIITNKHGLEMQELLDNEKQLGIKSGARSQLEAIHKREIRRFRTDELDFGLSIFVTMLLEQLRENPHKENFQGVNIIKKANGAMKRNANEKLLLTSLLISLSELT
jgi:DNA polymerase-3 subunit delta'